MNAASFPTPLGSVLRDVSDENRLAQNWARIQERRQGMSMTHRTLLAVSAVAAVFIGIGVIWSFMGGPPTPTPQGEQQQPLSLAVPELMPVMTVPVWSPVTKAVPLSDGSQLTIAPGATLEVTENTTRRFRTALQKGWVRFDVKPGRDRTWIIDTNLVRIEVVGTQFTVSRTAESVTVSVHRGKVRLHPKAVSNTPPRDVVELTAGEKHRLTLAEKQNIVSTVGETKEIPSHFVVPDTVRSDTKTSQKRTYAPQPKAKRPPISGVTDLAGLGASKQVNAMLKEADQARKEKRHRKAARLLARILDTHPQDPAFGLVALTLGRIRLDILNQPHGAIKAFRHAADFSAMPLSLREQAYAREVEALHQIQDPDRAKAAANRYRQRFPSGVWLPWVNYWAAFD